MSPQKSVGDNLSSSPSTASPSAAPERYIGSVDPPHYRPTGPEDPPSDGIDHLVDAHALVDEDPGPTPRS